MCAVTEDGELICNEAESTKLDQRWLKEVAKREQGKAMRRRTLYGGARHTAKK